MYTKQVPKYFYDKIAGFSAYKGWMDGTFACRKGIKW